MKEKRKGDECQEKVVVKAAFSLPRPEKYENAVVLLRLGQPSTLIRHETELFENALQNGGIKKRQLYVNFGEDGKHFENGTFRRRWHFDNMLFSCQSFFSNTNLK